MDKYIVIEKAYLTHLQEEVNRMILQGYVPQGGVTFFVKDSGLERQYLQAMVLKERYTIN